MEGNYDSYTVQLALVFKTLSSFLEGTTRRAASSFEAFITLISGCFLSSISYGTQTFKELDSLNHFEGKNSPGMLEHSGATTDAKSRWKQIGDEEKKVTIQEEMKRMHQLPTNSSYATHRLRVLNKILQLMSVQRSASQEEELELLFAGLSL